MSDLSMLKKRRTALSWALLLLAAFGLVGSGWAAWASVPVEDKPAVRLAGPPSAPAPVRPAVEPAVRLLTPPPPAVRPAAQAPVAQPVASAAPVVASDEEAEVREPASVAQNPNPPRSTFSPPAAPGGRATTAHASDNVSESRSAFPPAPTESELQENWARRAAAPARYMNPAVQAATEPARQIVPTPEPKTAPAPQPTVVMAKNPPDVSVPTVPTVAPYIPPQPPAPTGMPLATSTFPRSMPAENWTASDLSPVTTRWPTDRWPVEEPRLPPAPPTSYLTARDAGWGAPAFSHSHLNDYLRHASLVGQEGDQAGQDATAAPGNANGQQGEQQKLGEAPPDETLQFLRRQAVLLSEGDWQFDVGLVYSIFDRHLPVNLVDPNTGDLEAVVDGRNRRTLMYIPFAVRYGLTDKIQLFTNLPVGWASSQISFPNEDETSSVFGVGDLYSGASFVLREGCGYCPHIIGTLGVIAPTGPTNFQSAVLVPDSQLGLGMWGTTADLLFIHTYDPVVVFYGFGATLRMAREFSGVHFNPGEQYNYQLGMGFAVNPNVTLSARFFGSYITENEIDGIRVAGSNIQPQQIRFAITMVRGHKILEPFATVGMTEDAPSSQIGIVWTY